MVVEVREVAEMTNVMRIDTLPQNNVQAQGPSRREWLRQHSPQHLQQCIALTKRALGLRVPATSRSTLVLGAGACTEVPLADLARASDEVVLADLDLTAYGIFSLCNIRHLSKGNILFEILYKHKTIGFV